MVYEKLSPQQLYMMSYKENDDQNPQTPIDNALVWRKLLEQKVFATEIAIAESVGMSNSNVTKTLAILNLDRRDRNSVVSGKSVSVRVDLGGSGIIQKKKKKLKIKKE